MYFQEGLTEGGRCTPKVAPFVGGPHIESRERMRLACLPLLPGVSEVSCCWRHSSLPSQPNFFDLLIRNKDQQLFRTLQVFSIRPGLWEHSVLGTEQQLGSLPLQCTGSHCWMTRLVPRDNTHPLWSGAHIRAHISAPSWVTSHISAHSTVLSTS